MKELKNPELQNKNGWSIVRKGQLIGALVGAIGTMVLLSFAFFLLNNMPKSTHGDDAAALNYQEAFLMIIALPYVLICRLFHYAPLINPSETAGIIGLCLVIVINAILSSMIGYFICHAFYRNKRQDKP